MLTQSAIEIQNRMMSANKQLKEMTGDLPFNYRKATPGEIKARVASLTPEILVKLIEKDGRSSVNELLKQYGGM